MKCKIKRKKKGKPLHFINHKIFVCAAMNFYDDLISPYTEKKL